MAKVGSAVALVVAAGTAVCGLMLLGTVGPTAAGAEAPAIDDLTSEASSDASSTDDTTTTTATTTTATTTTTTTIAAPTTPVAVAASPVPLSVSPSTVTVGAGGVAEISGTCDTVNGDTAGPVVIWEIGDGVRRVATGVAGAAWTYQWTAPTTVAPLVLQAWCGDPNGFAGEYPAELRIDVVFVAQAPTATTVPSSTIASVIPETS